MASFDSIDHAALMDRVRRRVKDKRVLGLVKAFLKAGILTELGENRDTNTGTPQGGILSPLLANIALQVLDEHLQDQWRQLMGNEYRRTRRRRLGLGTWRLVRYADDFVVLVFGSRENVDSVRDEITAVLAGIGLRLSPTKTQIVHMSEGFDFLGFHIQWRRKFGTNRWHVYTFIADRPIRQLKDKIRALTRRTSQQNLRGVLIRLGLIMRGWANYFKYAVCKHVFRKLAALTWWRVIKWQMQMHRWRWKDVRRWLTNPAGNWKPITADGIALFNIAAVPVTRYRYRGNAIPNPWNLPASA